MKGPRGGLQSPRARHTRLGGQGILPRRWSVRHEGPAMHCPRPAHTNLGRQGVGASRRACEAGCSHQAPGTPAGGDRGSCPGGGRCVMKGPRGGLQSPRGWHTSLGGQGVLPKRWSVRHEAPAMQCPRPAHTNLVGQGVLSWRWSVRPEGLARMAAVIKARAQQPSGTGGLAQAVVGAS